MIWNHCSEKPNQAAMELRTLTSRLHLPSQRKCLCKKQQCTITLYSVFFPLFLFGAWTYFPWWICDISEIFPHLVKCYDSDHIQMNKLNITVSSKPTNMQNSALIWWLVWLLHQNFLLVFFFFIIFLTWAQFLTRHE